MNQAFKPLINKENLTYFEDLNESQCQAVETTDGPVLVLAGAGTGKTRVLTTRFAHILLTGRARNHEILAVTFTNKTAQEMRERVESLLGYSSCAIWLGTFHSVATRILRRHAENIGLSNDFTILGADDQLRLIKQLIKDEGLDNKNLSPRMVLSVINRWKDRGLFPDKVSLEERKHFNKESEVVLKLYTLYQERLRILNSVDFGDLLLLCLKLFIDHNDVLNHYQDQFHYILVDEYQDANVAQYLWLKLLSQKSLNICCVGDDDQSIYGWRGAEVSNILRFEKDFPGAKIIRLEQNYRSTHHILSAASGLIAHNQGRLGKTLWTTDDKKGEKILIRGVWDGDEEARYVCGQIEVFQRKEILLSSIAVLVRAGFQTREFEDRLMVLGIPYRVIGGPRFYERLEIRDALAYLRVVYQPKDSLAFERIVNTPRRGVGKVSLQALHQLSRHDHISLIEATRQLIETDEIKGQARRSLKKLIEQIDQWRSTINTMIPSELAKCILNESGYIAMWKADKSPDALKRLENLKEFYVAMDEFESLQDFMDHISLITERQQNSHGDAVYLMTLHSAKGLEFDVVFLAGWEEGLFPHPRSIAESGKKGLEEERRLAYVGITRAKRNVIITYAANRRVHGTWQSTTYSRFVEELPKDYVKLIHPGVSDFYQPQKKWPHIKLKDLQEPVKYAKSLSSHQLGDRVFHIKFGYGYVKQIEGNKLSIDFEHSGLKIILSSFVQSN